MKNLSRYLFVSLLNLNSIILFSQSLAFPGAEGYGKESAGGRGGNVIKVTNLDDSGVGSLRYALENYKNQPRTIIFDTSGIIELQSEIKIKYDSYITIAGQTAPGDGICLKNFPLTISDCHDIIIRYIRSRPGDEQDCGTSCDVIDAMNVRTGYNIILDHCSLSWSIDAILDLTVETGWSTVQYCLLSEALFDSKHPKNEPHSMAAGWDGNSKNGDGEFGGGSYHHNLIASCNSRTPRLDKYLGVTTLKPDLIEIANNVIYNWDGNGAYGGENAYVNWVSNYYKYGPETSRKDQIFQADGDCQMYMDGNFVYGYPNVTANNSIGLYLGSVTAGTTKSDVLLDKVFYGFSTNHLVGLQSATDAYQSVLNGVGAALPKRDSIDTRIINDVKHRTGKIIDSQTEVGGWQNYISDTAYTDTDNDGMPDFWEDKYELDKSNANDRNDYTIGNAYTNLEVYLNSIEFNDSAKALYVEKLSSGNYKITWDESYIGEDSIKVERSVNGGNYELAGMADRYTNAVIDSLAPAEGILRYRIYAMWSSGLNLVIASPYKYQTYITDLEITAVDTFYVGDSIKLSALEKPEGTSGAVAWSVAQEYASKGEIVSENYLKGLDSGLVIVTAQSADGGPVVSTTKEIYVAAKPVSVFNLSADNNLMLSPNPFTEEIKITFFVEPHNSVELYILNTLGQKVFTFKQVPDISGRYNLIWNGSDNNGNKMTPGIYFCVLKTNTNAITKTICLQNR